MSAIAQALTVDAAKGDLGPVSRMATLWNLLAPDIHVSIAPSSAGAPGAGERVPRQVVGRDAVLALVGRWAPPAGGVTVEFVDVQVTLNESGAEAQVYCTAAVTTRGPSGQPAVDARELSVGFAHVEGAWVVTSVRPEETLSR